MTQRIYNCTDLELLNAARDFATSLQVDLADFSAIDTSFDAAFLSTFETEIAVAESIDPSNSIEAQMHIATEAVKAQMEVPYAVPSTTLWVSCGPAIRCAKRSSASTGCPTCSTARRRCWPR